MFLFSAGPIFQYASWKVKDGLGWKHGPFNSFYLILNRNSNFHPGWGHQTGKCLTCVILGSAGWTTFEERNWTDLILGNNWTDYTCLTCCTYSWIGWDILLWTAGVNYGDMFKSHYHQLSHLKSLLTMLTMSIHQLQGLITQNIAPIVTNSNSWVPQDRQTVQMEQKCFRCLSHLFTPTPNWMNLEVGLDLDINVFSCSCYIFWLHESQVQRSEWETVETDADWSRRLYFHWFKLRVRVCKLCAANVSSLSITLKATKAAASRTKSSSTTFLTLKSGFKKMSSWN